MILTNHQLSILNMLNEFIFGDINAVIHIFVSYDNEMVLLKTSFGKVMNAKYEYTKTSYIKIDYNDKSISDMTDQFYVTTGLIYNKVVDDVWNEMIRMLEDKFKTDIATLTFRAIDYV